MHSLENFDVVAFGGDVGLGHCVVAVTRILIVGDLLEQLIFKNWWLISVIVVKLIGSRHWSAKVVTLGFTVGLGVTHVSVFGVCG